MANKQPTKHWKLDDDMIPSHDLCIKMLKKYPELNASYDGAMILNDGEYFTEDFIHGLWIGRNTLKCLTHLVIVVVLFQKVEFMFIVVK